MGLNTTPQILLLIHQQQTDLENIVGKGEIARNEQFLPFLKCFLLMLIIVSPFVHIFAIISLFAAELEEPKIGISFRPDQPAQSMQAHTARYFLQIPQTHFDRAGLVCFVKHSGGKKAVTCDFSP